MYYIHLVLPTVYFVLYFITVIRLDTVLLHAFRIMFLHVLKIVLLFQFDIRRVMKTSHHYQKQVFLLVERDVKSRKPLCGTCVRSKITMIVMLSV